MLCTQHGLGVHTRWPLLLDVALQAPIKGLAGSLTGAHEDNLNLTA